MVESSKATLPFPGVKTRLGTAMVLQYLGYK